MPAQRPTEVPQFPRPICPGVELNEAGEAIVDASLTEPLINLAIELDDDSRFPVDVEHVLAAIVMAADALLIGPETDLTQSSPQLKATLSRFVELVFVEFRGRVGEDD